MKSTDYKYFAFISYKREDEEWAKWLQFEFEHYKLPVSLNGRKDVPTEFRPIFRDVDELSAGNLPNQIYESLRNSANLIVICSPKSACSKWVNKEITDFVKIGQERGVDNIEHIFPFIVEGCPHSNNEEECFPDALRNLSGSLERIGGNVNESGRDKAFIKVLSGIIHVGFDELWDRFERERIEHERRRREDRNRLLLAQSFYLSEKSMNYLEEGDSYMARMLALEALPKKLGNPDERPYSPEAELALRMAEECNDAVFRNFESRVGAVAFHPHEDILAALTSSEIIMLKPSNGAVLLKKEDCCYQSLVFSPDGARLLAIAVDEAHVIDSTTLKIVLKLPDNAIKSAEYSKDGRKIVLADGYGNISVRDAVDGNELLSLKYDSKRVNHASFSPDGTKIVSAHDDKIIEWDVAIAEAIRITKNSRIVEMAIYNPSGKGVLYTSGEEICGFSPYTVARHNHLVNTIMFSPDGNKVVSSSFDAKVRTWWDKNRSHVFDGHTKVVNSAVFSPDGKFVASASSDGTVRLWEDIEDYVKDNWAEDNIPILTGLTRRWLANFKFSPDEKFLVYTDGLVVGLLDTRTRLCSVLYRTPEEYGKDVYLATYFSHDGNILAVLSNSGEINCFDIRSRERIHFLDRYALIASLEFSHDDKKVVIIRRDRTLLLVDALAGEQLLTIDENFSSLGFAIFSPDDRFIAFEADCSVIVWDIVNNKKILESTCLFASRNAMAFSPDCKYLAVIRGYTLSHEICVIDLKTAKQKFMLNGHKDKVMSVCFSNDGKLLVSSSKDRTVRLWSMEYGTELRKYDEYDAGVISCTISTDGSKILTVTENELIAKVLDINSGKLANCIKYPYSLSTRYSMQFSANGRYVMVDSGNSGIHLKELLPLQELIDRNAERFKDRPLSPEEKAKYYL